MTPTKAISQATDWLSRLAASIAAKPRLVRWILGGPVAIVATLLIMMGMASWWPEGAARVDNIVMPIVLFPLIWAAVFFYALLEDTLPRAVVVMVALIAGHLALVFM